MLPSQAVILICVSAILPFLAFISIVLRVKARQVKRIKLNVSDYFIFFTLLNAICNAVACIIGGIACGVGQPLSQLPEYMRSRFLKILFVTQYFYCLSVFSVKVSVVLFYKSVFTTPGFKRAANATLVILSAWVIAIFFVTTFQDKPISRNWGTVGTTIDFVTFYVVEIATDIALDLSILCMPLPWVSRLHISTRKKWLLSGIFWLGAFCVIASTVRLYYMVLFKQQYQVPSDDFSAITVNIMIWGAIEPCTSIIAACLPMLGPVLLKRRREPSKETVLSSFFRKARSTPSGQTLRHVTSESAEPFNHEATISDGFPPSWAGHGSSKGSMHSSPEARLTMPNAIKVNTAFGTKVDSRSR